MSFKIKIPDSLINNIFQIAESADPQVRAFAWEAVNMQMRGQGKYVGGYWEFSDPTGNLQKDMVVATFVGAAQPEFGVMIEGLALWLEMPKTNFETDSVLEGLPNRTYIDENEVEQVHTWESWASDGLTGDYTHRENIAGDRVVFGAKPKGSKTLSNVEFLPIYAAILGGADIVPHTNESYKENILNNASWIV